MRLIESKAEILQQGEGLEGIYKQIELAGRTCYKSSDKITENSAEPFVDRMIKSNHLAMCEHNALYLKTEDTTNDENYWILVHSPYTKTIYYNGWNYVTTNLRTIIELFPTIYHGFINSYKCEPTEYHEKRYAFKLVCSRAISHEIVRHRSFSFAQESQRYCGYNKDKFNGEITYIIPNWLKVKNNTVVPTPRYINKDYMNSIIGWAKVYEPNEIDFLDSLLHSEVIYLGLLNGDTSDNKLQPQLARDVLPNATKTEIVMTGFSSDYRHFFDLRYFGKTGAPHPDMLQLATKMKETAEEAGIWEDIMKQPSKFEQYVRRQT